MDLVATAPDARELLSATGLVPFDAPPSLTPFLTEMLPRVQIVSSLQQCFVSSAPADMELFQELKDEQGVTLLYKPKDVLLLCTHSGKFHADEVFAVALRLLKAMLDGTQHVVIVRTRDEATIRWADEVYDVGHVHDEARRRFDHHQSGFNVCFFPHPNLAKAAQQRLQMASSGLVYKWIGKEVIQGLYPEFPLAEVDAMHDELYKSFVEQLDAMDNGRPLAAPFHDGSKPKITFRVTTHISAQVGEMNASINSKGPSQNQRFFYAMVKVITPFLYKLHEMIQKMQVAAPIVSRALKECLARGDRILFLDEPCPWKRMYDRLKNDAQLEKEDVPMFCVLPGDQGSFMLMTVPLDATQPWLGSEAKLPQAWAGMQSKELDAVTGLSGTKFCHAGRWIAGAKTKEVAMTMAKQAIVFAEREQLQDSFGTEFAYDDDGAAQRKSMELTQEKASAAGGGGGVGASVGVSVTRANPVARAHAIDWTVAKAQLQQFFDLLIDQKLFRSPNIAAKAHSGLGLARLCEKHEKIQLKHKELETSLFVAEEEYLAELEKTEAATDAKTKEKASPQTK